MRKLFAFALVATLALAIVPTAAAHKTVYTTDGKIKIAWGFLNEPAVTWTKSGLDLVLADNATGAPITGAADTIEVHLKYGDKELHLDDLAGRFGAPGAYTQAVTLTKPGLYAINIHGTINGSVIDMDIAAAHEIADVEETFFPEAESPFAEDEEGDDAALLDEITALKARVAALEATAQTMATDPATVSGQPAATSDVPGPGLLLAAIAAVGAALLLRRKA